MSALLVWFFCDKRALLTLLFYVVCDVPYHRDIYRLSEALTVLCPSLHGIYLLADVALLEVVLARCSAVVSLVLGFFLLRLLRKCCSWPGLFSVCPRREQLHSLSPNGHLGALFLPSVWGIFQDSFFTAERFVVCWGDTV